MRLNVAWWTQRRTILRRASRATRASARIDTPIMGGDKAGTGLMLGGGDGVAGGVAVGVEAISSQVQEVGLQVCPRAHRVLVHIGGPQPPTPPLHTQLLPDGTQVPNSPQVPAQEPQGPPGVTVGVADGVAEGVPGGPHMQVAGLHA